MGATGRAVASAFFGRIGVVLQQQGTMEAPRFFAGSCED